MSDATMDRAHAGAAVDDDETPTRDDDQDGKPELTEHEHDQVEELSRPRALLVHEVVRKEGEHELERPVSSLLWSGLAAGLSMGFSLVTEGLLRSALPDRPWRPLIAKLGYTVGFVLVVLARQQLFTENTLTPVLPVLHQRSGERLAKMLRLWGAVLAANLAGALLFAWVIGHTQVFRPEHQQAFLEIGREAVEGSFLTLLVRAVFAGWLIALMVWMLPSSSANLATVVVLTYLVGLGRLTHSIAGSVDVLYTVVTGHASWGLYLGHFLVPALLGNVIGGVSLVAMLNHAQVKAELQRGGGGEATA